jgi:hypothetical protein
LFSFIPFKLYNLPSFLKHKIKSINLAKKSKP